MKGILAAVCAGGLCVAVVAGNANPGRELTAVAIASMDWGSETPGAVTEAALLSLLGAERNEHVETTRITDPILLVDVQTRYEALAPADPRGEDVRIAARLEYSDGTISTLAISRTCDWMRRSGQVVSFDSRLFDELVSKISARQRMAIRRWAPAVCRPPLRAGRDTAETIEQLRSPRPDVRADAAFILGEEKSRQAVGPLIGLLRDPDPQVASAAAEALGTIGDRRATPPLVVALQRPEAGVRMDAARSLARLRDPRSIPGLAVARRDPDAAVRLAAVEALATVSDERVAPELARALGDERAAVRRAAAEGLAAIGADVRVLKPLIAALEDSDPGVSDMAATALRTLTGGVGLDALVAASRSSDLRPDVRASAVASLGTKLSDARSLDAVIEAVGDPDPGVQRAAVQALRQTRDPRSRGAILGVTTSKDDKLRREALMALVGKNGPGVLDALTLALRDPCDDVRAGAAFVLGELADPAAVEPLIEKLGDAAALVRRSAAVALGRTKDRRAATALEKLLADPDSLVREAAAEALEAMGTTTMPERED